MSLFKRFISAISILFYLLVSNSIHLHTHHQLTDTTPCEHHDEEHSSADQDHSDCAICFFQITPHALDNIEFIDLPTYYSITYFEYLPSQESIFEDFFSFYISNKGPPLFA